MPRINCLNLAGALLVLLLALAAAGSAQSPPADSDCLACHSQKELKSAAGRSVYVDQAKHQSSIHGALGCTTCHSDIKEIPHGTPVAKVDCATCHAAESKDVASSSHGLLGAQACESCHGPAHNIVPWTAMTADTCAKCHQAGAGLRSSVHARVENQSADQASRCGVCHGVSHRILAADDPRSLVAKKNLPQTCGACHSNPQFLADHQIPFAHPVESYELSIHGRLVAAGNPNAPSCSDCHSNHDILPTRDSRSKTNHANVPATCGSCHADVAKIYAQSIHGQAAAKGVRDAPVCTDCHGEHLILAPSEPQSTVFPSRVSSVTCGRCHGDEQLNARYNLPADRLSTFADSYHGLATRSGSQTVANCASCHGVHNIFPSSDLRSTVNPANLAKTCGSCHPGAGQDFAIGPVHVRADSQIEHPVVKWIRWIYLFLIPLTVGFMFLHHLLDFLHKAAHPVPRASKEQLERMNIHFRIAHWLTAVSFPILVLTGFALKYPESWWVQPLRVWASWFAFRGTLHRIAGVVLLSSLGYHVLHLILVRRDRVIIRAILPRFSDLQDARRAILYNLGVLKERPLFGKFSYVEKIEYLAFLWGTMIMAATGFVLWFNNLALRYLPKWVSDAATSLHFYEAILATAAILIWHFYTVIFDPDVYPMDRSWLTGKTSAEHLRHTRPAYYTELMRRQHPATDTPAKEAVAGEPKKSSDSPGSSPGGKEK